MDDIIIPIDVYIKTLNDAWDLLSKPFDDKFEDNFEKRICRPALIPMFDKNERYMKGLISELKKNKKQCEQLYTRYVPFESFNSIILSDIDRQRYIKLTQELPFNSQDSNKWHEKLELRFIIFHLKFGSNLKEVIGKYKKTWEELYDIICRKKNILEKLLYKPIESYLPNSPTNKHDENNVSDLNEDLATCTTQNNVSDLDEDLTTCTTQNNSNKVNSVTDNKKLVFRNLFSEKACDNLHLLLIKNGFIDPLTPIKDLYYVFSIKKDFSTSHSPIKWIKPRKSVENNKVNRKSLIDLLTLLGYKDIDIRGEEGQKYKRLNHCFIIESGPFSSKDFKNKSENGDAFINANSEYHNDLKKIVDKIGMPQKM